MNIVELIIASQTIHRFSNNTRLHASSLNNHFEALRNTMGLLDYTNRQNTGLKATIKQLNQLIYHLSHNNTIPRDSVEMIRDIDLTAKPGAISIAKQFKAFQDTKKLLEKECDDFKISIADHIKKAQEVRNISLKVPDKTKSVIEWLDKEIIPSLENARNMTTELENAIIAIPVIQTENEIDKLSMESINYEMDNDD